MTRLLRRLALAAAATGAVVVIATALAAAAVAPPPVIGGGVPKNQAPACKGITVCYAVLGPWVLVPAHGQVEYLVQCHTRIDVVAGTNVPTSAKDIRVTFDAFPYAPLKADHTTHGFAIFRGVSVDGKAGAFQPQLGCIPRKGGGGGSTNTLAPMTRPGQTLPGTGKKPKPTLKDVPLDPWAKTVMLAATGTRKTTIACPHIPVENTNPPKYEHIVSGLEWSTVALGTTTAPTSSVAESVVSAIHTTLTYEGTHVTAVITSADAGLQDMPEVQVGVVCAT
jgi:hypothetical protein